MPKMQIEDMTYREYLDFLTLNAQRDPSSDTAALMLAASLEMQKVPAGTPCDPVKLNQVAERLKFQPAFRELMKDPEVISLIREGKNLDLVEKLNEKEQEVIQERQKYVPPPERMKDDAQFLKDAMDAADAVTSGAAQVYRQSRAYNEMMKQMEYARSMAEQGIPLNADASRSLVNAVKKYNDGGSKVPGGVRKAPANVQAMCVLKQYMPPEEFEAYCKSINEAHPKRHADPNTFTKERMTGKAKTARELQKEYKVRLQKGLTEDACAGLVALRRLSKNNPNALITTEMLEKEKKRLMSRGSAFKRAMSNEVDREMFKILASQGKITALSRAIDRRSSKHAVNAAKWQTEKSVEALQGLPPKSAGASKHLAGIIVANQMAQNAGPGTIMSKKAFSSAVEQMQKDPAFMQMAARFADDPSYAASIKGSLAADPSGGGLAQEYQRIANPAPTVEAARQMDNPVLQAPQLRAPHLQAPMMHGPVL